LAPAVFICAGGVKLFDSDAGNPSSESEIRNPQKYYRNNMPLFINIATVSVWLAVAAVLAYYCFGNTQRRR
jgi:hypothetical protein